MNDECLTCFSAHMKYKLPCEEKTCRQWINNENNHNCTIATILKNGHGLTLNEIGSIHNLTRMRVCQIEKKALSRVKEDLFENADL
jgi:DNA-directed RNA polymerase sigma subunit (sigma70/sigma32)